MHWWPHELEGTYGVDLFIGDLKSLGKGFGSKLLKSFVQQFSENHKVQKWIVDVDPTNARAIRCFEKAGFHFVEEIDTPEGKAIIMESLEF